MGCHRAEAGPAFFHLHQQDVQLFHAADAFRLHTQLVAEVFPHDERHLVAPAHPGRNAEGCAVQLGTGPIFIRQLGKRLLIKLMQTVQGPHQIVVHEMGQLPLLISTKHIRRISGQHLPFQSGGIIAHRGLLHLDRTTQPIREQVSHSLRQTRAGSFVRVAVGHNPQLRAGRPGRLFLQARCGQQTDRRCRAATGKELSPCNLLLHTFRPFSAAASLRSSSGVTPKCFL